MPSTTAFLEQPAAEAWRLLLGWVMYGWVEEASVAGPPNYSGYDVIKFSILPKDFKKYHYDTKPKEEEFPRGN